MSVRGLSLGLMLLQAATSPSAVTWSPKMGVATLAAIDGLLSEPMNGDYAAVLDDGSVHPMKTCRDLLPLVDAGLSHLSPDDSTVGWQLFQGEVVRCTRLKILKQARPASASYLGWFSTSASAILKLPAGVAPSFSDRELKAVAKASKGCTSWRTYDRHLRVTVKDDHGALDTPGWAGHIYLLVRGDLNGDGIEDLLIERQAVLKQDGTIPNSSAQLFIVTQDAKTKCPRIVWELLDLGG
jgi:hypothetical protein